MFTPQKPVITKPVQPVHSGRGNLVAIVGPPGVGKSSALALFKKVEFICDPRDQSILDLIDYEDLPRPNKVTVVDDFDRLEKAILAFRDSENKVLVNESLTGIGALCNDICLIQQYDNKPSKFQAYQNGYDDAANIYFQKLIDLWLSCQAAGKIVFLTGHTKVGGGGKNVSGEDWVSSTVDTSPQIGRRLQATFPNIFNIGWKTATEQAGARQKALDQKMYLYTGFNPLFPAKSKLGLGLGEAELEYPSKRDDVYKLYCKLLRLSPETNKRIA